MNDPDFSHLYVEYHDRVMGYLSARIRSKADAEDLCQDVFEKVFTKFDSYDPQKSSISTWIFTITRNRVIDFFRKNHPSSEIDENMAEDASVDDDLLNNETLKELAAALVKLPVDMRDIIVLRYYDKLPLTDISKKMGISYGAIKIRHAKALELLPKDIGSGRALQGK